jgi:hypothetical protein
MFRQWKEVSSLLKKLVIHTNMAKQLCYVNFHTTAGGGKPGIFMNAVDTGWSTDDPAELAK